MKVPNAPLLIPASRDLVVVGGGGHAKVVLELLRAGSSYNVIGFLDPNRTGYILGVPILGGDELLPALLRSGVRHAFVALGANGPRLAATRRLQELGFVVPPVVSPAATVSPSASIAAGAAVMAGATINAEAVVAEGAIVNTNASIDHDCVVGPFAHCAPGTHLAGNVIVDEGALLGVGACAIPGVRIGAWSIIGAGSVIIEDIPAAVMAAGAPARILSSES